jgi:DNA-binding CsgD family transcriptional regulator
LVCYEKIKGATNWWYQARIDITRELKERFKQDGVLLGPACWEGNFAPLARNTTVPITNVLEAMPAAGALIMARGRMLDANRALFAILREGDGLLKMDDRVVAREPSEQAEFQRRLARFFEAGTRGSPIAMRISRRECHEPYFLSVSSLLNLGQETWGDGHIAVLTVANPAAAPVLDPAMLAEFFGITRAEAEVAAALGAGHTVAFIARQRGATLNTVYSQIRKIVEKTGYNGQTDIARRVTDLARIFGRQRSTGENR